LIVLKEKVSFWEKPFAGFSGIGGVCPDGVCPAGVLPVSE
jgi:hypothetical protein